MAGQRGPGFLLSVLRVITSTCSRYWGSISDPYTSEASTLLSPAQLMSFHIFALVLVPSLEFKCVV